MPEVSIVIPTFNRAKSLKKTLDGILSQTYKSYEVIIVSNGSTDNTEEIVGEFKDKRLKYIFQKGSGSPASPRNTGIRNSKGNFIAFCDDDDIWLPQKLEKQVSFFKNTPKCGLCYTKMTRFNSEKEWINPDDEGTKDSINSRDLLYKNIIPLSSVLIRKEILKNMELFDEDKKIAGAEDYELILRLSKKTSLICISEYLLMYYSGGNRFTNSVSKSSFKTNLKYIARLYHVYKKIVKKGYFSLQEVFFPFLFNVRVIFKIMLYDFLHNLGIKA